MAIFNSYFDITRGYSPFLMGKSPFLMGKSTHDSTPLRRGRQQLQRVAAAQRRRFQWQLQRCAELRQQRQQCGTALGRQGAVAKRGQGPATWVWLVKKNGKRWGFVELRWLETWRKIDVKWWKWIEWRKEMRLDWMIHRLVVLGKWSEQNGIKWTK